MIYFWSDVHFSHRKIMEFCPSSRPFKDVDEMNAAIIERWNKRVRSNDDIYFLGDFSFDKHPEGHFYQLNGRKHLIVGNHDSNRKAVMALPWDSIADIKTVRYNGSRAVLCHFPIESWHDMHHGSLHFHGHSHGNLEHKLAHRFDVGFDALPNGPASFDELIELAQNEFFESVDHHGARKEYEGGK